MLKVRREAILEYAGVAAAMLVALVIYALHWRFELPLHPQADEGMITGGVQSLINDSIWVNLGFKYPHLTIYVGYLAYKFVSVFYHISDMVYFLRVIICGLALLSNLCMYLVGKKITGSKRYGFICLLVALFSMYQFQYLYYVGPDAMLYAISNAISFLAVEMYYAEDDKTVSYYPWMAVLIGLAISAKYHGVLLGVLWLAVHVSKGFWKDKRKNVTFVKNCFVIVLSFFVCNWKAVLAIKHFIDDFLFNFQHYATGHIGIEHNSPLLAYMEAWVLHEFGLVGTIIFILGAIYCFRSQSKRKLAIILFLVPVILLIILTRSKISLGRNVAQILPVFYIFETYGFVFLEENLRHIRCGGGVCMTIVVILTFCNISAMLYMEGYKDSYSYIESWIPEHIEEGATVYVDAVYAPVFDIEKYDVRVVEQLPAGVPELETNEYYITSSYTFGRYIQQKDYYVLSQGYMYPEYAEIYNSAVEKLDCILNLEGVSQIFDSNFRVKYMDFFVRNHNVCYEGPTINVYKGREECK